MNDKDRFKLIDTELGVFKERNEFEAKAIEMFKNDMSNHEIANALNTYPTKIRRILIKNGYTPRNRSETQKVALKKGTSIHPTQGRERTDEEKLKISTKLVTYWDEMSDVEKQSRIDQSKANWEAMSHEKRQHMRKLSNEALKRAAKEGSKIENKIYEALTKDGYHIDFHTKKLIRNDKLEIDLYIPDLKTIIEIDGPSHYLPIWGEEKLKKQIEADAEKDGLVLSQGFVMIRVKILKTNLSLKHEKDLIDLIIIKLKKIEKHFPRKSNRYIEVEL